MARSVHDDDAKSKVRGVVQDATRVAREEVREYGREYNSESGRESKTEGGYTLLPISP